MAKHVWLEPSMGEHTHKGEVEYVGECVVVTDGAEPGYIEVTAVKP